MVRRNANAPVDMYELNQAPLMRRLRKTDSEIEEASKLQQA